MPIQKLKTIVAGSRSISDYSIVEQAIEASGFSILEIVSGESIGVDKQGEIWAKKNNIPIVRFPAKWNQHGNKAGYLRNVEMAEYADALIAIWEAESRGTRHMIQIAKNHNLKIFLKVIE